MSSVVVRNMGGQTDPSGITIGFHDFGRDVFLGHRRAVLVDDGLVGFRGCCFVGPRGIGGTVAGDARVGAVLAGGSHCCG
jgi:hypothetical protein